MAKTVNLTWVDPAIRVNGDVLTPAEIASVRVSMSADAGGSFVELGSVAAGVQTFSQADLPDGTYQFKVVVFDTQTPTKSSAGVVVSVDVVTVVVLADPADVSNLTASVV